MMREDENRQTPCDQGGCSRRRMLTLLSVALGGVGTLLAGVPIVGFLLGPVLRQQAEAWVDIGPVHRFAAGETVEVAFQDPRALPWAGTTGKAAAWLRRETDDRFTAFVVNCTHLGCPVRWEPEAKLFMCPCHGGVYYSNGQVAGGPPPKPLFRYQTRVANGQVQLKTRPMPIT